MTTTRDEQAENERWATFAWGFIQLLGGTDEARQELVRRVVEHPETRDATFNWALTQFPLLSVEQREQFVVLLKGLEA